MFSYPFLPLILLNLCSSRRIFHRTALRHGLAARWLTTDAAPTHSQASAILYMKEELIPFAWYDSELCTNGSLNFVVIGEVLILSGRPEWNQLARLGSPSCVWIVLPPSQIWNGGSSTYIYHRLKDSYCADSWVLLKLSLAAWACKLRLVSSF